jgi:hypothetical protein
MPGVTSKAPYDVIDTIECNHFFDALSNKSAGAARVYYSRALAELAPELPELLLRPQEHAASASAVPVSLCLCRSYPAGAAVLFEAVNIA